MNFIKKLFLSKEVKAAFGILDEINCNYDGEAFQIMRKYTEKAILKDPADFTKYIREGKPVREFVYCSIANLAFAEVVTGKYHYYRGTMNEMGKDLLRLHDFCIDEISRMKPAEAKKDVEDMKVVIRERIAEVG